MDTIKILVVVYRLESFPPTSIIRRLHMTYMLD